MEAKPCRPGTTGIQRKIQAITADQFDGTRNISTKTAMKQAQIPGIYSQTESQPGCNGLILGIDPCFEHIYTIVIA
ncbi:hypothetical protein COW36_18195 [bacterium (Candidatus Blackallbacteria) CG17_big_fil_post_rev_8_21_14_2_50_48_46]|uniref:Uncharacterized protein n=1 Tax=bacterium (Candidatus Blackallbacteria) CG17_big_fil_post_rev_8_21_14_2_50_48_46 TaxID=2014261 RepID=A0A2M7G1D1_9BACT|nr:MAG: hypothetical protein COW36_18195 [bacterium (Candidatus Blackallbacteria) CG17_big_fil_post_rev_8_21_14_2_50_48_46]PIW49792.1 MAG: hypothetical protein COW20_05170 [bacterium (Candidatus Blackallbacteria) CG13_big_fil_rev_8_21_14_2_50_49_14]